MQVDSERHQRYVHIVRHISPAALDPATPTNFRAFLPLLDSHDCWVLSESVHVAGNSGVPMVGLDVDDLS